MTNPPIKAAQKAVEAVTVRQKVISLTEAKAALAESAALLDRASSGNLHSLIQGTLELCHAVERIDDKIDRLNNAMQSALSALREHGYDVNDYRANPQPSRHE